MRCMRRLNGLLLISLADRFRSGLNTSPECHLRCFHSEQYACWAFPPAICFPPIKVARWLVPHVVQQISH